MRTLKERPMPVLRYLDGAACTSVRPDRMSFLAHSFGKRENLAELEVREVKKANVRLAQRIVADVIVGGPSLEGTIGQLSFVSDELLKTAAFDDLEYATRKLVMDTLAQLPEIKMHKTFREA